MNMQWWCYCNRCGRKTRGYSQSFSWQTTKGSGQSVIRLCGQCAKDLVSKVNEEFRKPAKESEGTIQ